MLTDSTTLQLVTVVGSQDVDEIVVVNSLVELGSSSGSSRLGQGSVMGGLTVGVCFGLAGFPFLGQKMKH